MVTEALPRLLRSTPAGATFALMKHVTIRLADAEGVVLEERTVEGEYSSIDDYVAALVDAQGDARARARIEGLLLEGLEGEATEWTAEDAERLERLATNGQ